MKKQPSTKERTNPPKIVWWKNRRDGGMSHVFNCRWPNEFERIRLINDKDGIDMSPSDNCLWENESHQHMLCQRQRSDWSKSKIIKKLLSTSDKMNVKKDRFMKQRRDGSMSHIFYWRWQRIRKKNRSINGKMRAKIWDMRAIFVEEKNHTATIRLKTEKERKHE